MDLSERIEALQRNFYLSLSIMETAKNGRLTLDKFSFLPRNRNPFDQANMREEKRDYAYGATLPAVRNNFKSTFAFTVIELDSVFESMYSSHPVTEEDASIRYVRVLISLLGNSFINDSLNPVWECPPDFRNIYEAYNPYRNFDAREIHGMPIDWEQFGGIQGFIIILQTALDIARANERDNMEQHTFAPNQLRLKSRKKSEQYEHLKGFILTECNISDSSMCLASSLYAAYGKWASENSVSSISQRGFGIGLREFGFNRKRRGQGKHWWMGIQLISDDNREQFSMTLDI